MDIIVGGGKYGSAALEYLRKNKRGFVLVDKDPNCCAVKKYDLKLADQIETEGEYFREGGIEKVLELMEQLKPEYIFPAAPIHIAAELAKRKFNLAPWKEGIECILTNLPASVILNVGRGNLSVSYNRDKECLEKCEAPEVCPSTHKRKPCTMDKLIKFAHPKSTVIVSYQLAPGLGALKGNEVLEFLAHIKNNDKFVVSTACGCHGVVTALKRMPIKKAEK